MIVVIDYNVGNVRSVCNAFRYIGSEFIKAFKSEAIKIPKAKFLAQGTLYPDVIESGSKDNGLSANIKLHHNVGGLPAELGFELIEPLRDLFKDEVRLVGEYLGLPEDIVLATSLSWPRTCGENHRRGYIGKARYIATSR